VGNLVILSNRRIGRARSWLCSTNVDGLDEFEPFFVYSWHAKSWRTKGWFLPLLRAVHSQRRLRIELLDPHVWLSFTEESSNTGNKVTPAVFGSERS
jgi:hypothetical protein